VPFRPADSLATAIPTAVRGNLVWQSIGVGDGIACGLAGNQARCWALASYAMVPPFGSTTPTALADAPFFQSMWVGSRHACGLDLQGVAYCWGDNFRGQLGIGVVGATLWSRRQTPTPVATTQKFTALSLGGDWSCGLTVGGDVYCWGGGSGGSEAVPFGVVTGQNLASLKTGGNEASRDRTCALNGADTLYCWGTFQLGPPQPAAVAPSLPVTFRSFTLGGAPVQDPVTFNFQWHACALATDGQAFCWGENLGGQLGDASTTPRASPTPAADTLRFESISAGGMHTCGVTARGELYCWGSNRAGQLGTGSADSAAVTAPVHITVRQR